MILCIHAKRQPRTFFSKHRASIRNNQHLRNTCKHQRNSSVFSMKPRVSKPKKRGGSWDSNGGGAPCGAGVGVGNRILPSSYRSMSKKEIFRKRRTTSRRSCRTSQRGNSATRGPLPIADRPRDRGRRQDLLGCPLSFIETSASLRHPPAKKSVWVAAMPTLLNTNDTQDTGSAIARGGTALGTAATPPATRFAATPHRPPHRR